MNDAPSSSRAWLDLLRPANLFTAPGDPLAGFFLATGGAPASFAPVWTVAAIALLLYMAGVIGNDLADISEDRRDRPSRPLPSGRVSRYAAQGAMAALVLAALALAVTAGLAVLAAALMLQLLILSYNVLLKRFRWLGAVAMGSCRGLSLLLGAIAAGWRPAFACDRVLMAAAGMTLYIVGVTRIAADETRPTRIGPARWIPGLALALLLAVLAGGAPAADGRWLVLPLLLAAILTAFGMGRRLRGVPSPATLGTAVGGLIRNLLLVQAACCALGGRGGMVAAALLGVCLPLSVLTGRRFYAT